MASVSSCASCNTTGKLRPLECESHYKCMSCIGKVSGSFDCEQCSKPTSTSEKVYVFMDNSNIWIEAKKLGGPGGKEDKRVRVDAGTLLEIVAKERDIGEAILYGSEPPPLDTVWKEMKKQGWEVKTQERSQCTDKEKQIDTQMVADVTKLIYTNTPNNNVIILISGDADMIPAINAAFEEKWKVEIYMWRHATSHKLKKLNDQQDNNYSIYYLDDYQQKILFNSMKFPIAKNKKLLAIVRAKGIVCKMSPDAFKHNKGNPTNEWCKKVEKKFKETFRFFWIEELDIKTQQTVNSNILVLVFTEIKADSDKIADILASQRQSISINHVVEMDTYIHYEDDSKSTSPQLQLTNQYSLLDCVRNFEDDEILEQLGLSEDIQTEDNLSSLPVLSPVVEDIGLQKVKEEEEEEEGEGEWFTVEYKRKSKKSKQLYSGACKDGPNCQAGLDCLYMHTEEEKAGFAKKGKPSKPENYKTRQCNGKCTRPPDKCNFAHGEKDAVCNKCSKKGHFGANCKVK